MAWPAPPRTLRTLVALRPLQSTGWTTGTCLLGNQTVPVQPPVCLATKRYQYSHRIDVDMVGHYKVVRLFRNLFLLWLSAMSVALDLMHQPVLGLAAIFLWICLYSIWCYECLDLGPFAQICAQFEIFITGHATNWWHSTHTYRHRQTQTQHVCEKDRLSQIRASPINQPVWWSVIQGCPTFLCRFFWWKRGGCWDMSKTGYNQDNARILKYYQRKYTQITQTITQKVPIWFAFFESSGSLNHLSKHDPQKGIVSPRILLWAMDIPKWIDGRKRYVSILVCYKKSAVHVGEYTSSYCWWFRNPKQPAGMVLKPW